MSVFLVVMADLLYLFKIKLVYDNIFKFTKNKHKMLSLVISMLMVCIVARFVHMNHHDIQRMIFSEVLISVWLCWLYRESIWKNIISLTWISCIFTLLDVIFRVLLDVLSVRFGIGFGDAYTVCLSVMSLIFVYFIIRKYNEKYTEGITSLSIKSLLLFTVLTIMNAMVVVAIQVTNNVQEKGEMAFYIALIGVILGMFIQMIAVILLFVQKNIYKEKEEVTHKYLNEQKNHYEYLENREQETKKFRHDLRNHMYVMSDLIRNNEYEKVIDYMKIMDIKINQLGNAITVHNGIVDAILNQYYSEAVKKGIRMVVKGKFPNDCNVDTYDLCTIFSNVLSNAVEAAQLSSEKIIDIECRYTEKLITVIVKNTYKDIGQFDSGKISTLKSDENYHGFGLGNIKDSIAKCNGMLDIEISKEVFMVKIMLRYAEKRNDANSYN